jgi:hypothetical protein
MKTCSSLTFAIPHSVLNVSGRIKCVTTVTKAHETDFISTLLKKSIVEKVGLSP